MTQNIARLLAAAAVRAPEQPALISLGMGAPDQVLSFGELDAQSADLSAGLRELGLRAGDRVLILARPTLELYVCLAAMLRIGGVAVMPVPGSGVRDLERLAQRLPLRGVVAARATQAALRLLPQVGSCPIRINIDDAGLSRIADRSGSSPSMKPVDLDSDAPALITWTSGSTRSDGPRPVVRTHAVLRAQHRALTRALQQQPGDVDMTSFPVVALHNIAAGVSTLLVDKAAANQPSAEHIAQGLERWDVQRGSAAPRFWTDLAERCAAADRQLPLQSIVIGGAALSAALVEQQQRLAPAAGVIGIYGSSEAEPVAVLDAAEPDSRPVWAEASQNGAGAPLGHVVPEARLKVVGENGRALKPGQVGEAWISGEHVAFARHDDGRFDESRAPKDAAGLRWHAMGDIVRQDEDGALWLQGRSHSSIVRGRRRIHPVPIELGIQALPEAKLAALVGLPQIEPESGDRIVAAVVPRSGLSSAERRSLPARVRERCRKLAFDALDDLVTLDRLPVDARHGSRTDYSRLRRQLLKPDRVPILLSYLRERFPPGQYGALIASYFAANAFLAQMATRPNQSLSLDWRMAAGAVVLLLMFFHLRVIDEHRDHAIDRVVHPDRLLSRGLIDLRQLRSLGLAAIAIELVLSLAIGRAAFIATLLILLMSYLMLREFFIAEPLDDHMLANALLHMILMPFYALFVFSVVTDLPPWEAPRLVLLYAWVSYAAGLALELARKTRAPEDEREGFVTYSRDLGPHLPAYLALAALIVAGGISLFVGSQLGFAGWYHAAVILLLTCVSLGVAQHRLRTSTATAARLKDLTGLFIFGFDALLAIEILRLQGIRWP